MTTTVAAVSPTPFTSGAPIAATAPQPADAGSSGSADADSATAGPDEAHPDSHAAEGTQWPGPNRSGAAPSPDFPTTLPEWTLSRSWTGTARAFPGQWTAAPGPDNMPYTAPQNHCDSGRILVRWRALNPNATVIATDQAPRDPSLVTANAGWMDLDACHVPAFQFAASTDASTLTDVTVAIQQWSPAP